MGKVCAKRAQIHGIMILRKGGNTRTLIHFSSMNGDSSTKPHPTSEKNPYRLGNTSHRKQQPCLCGAFYLKGCEMKKYCSIDFDEKGNAVLGTAKNNPTSNGFIPTTWAPGGGDEGKNGIKSVTISPAITTTPALESMFPIYYEDLTEEQKQQGISITCARGDFTPGEYTLTVEPTSDWYAGIQSWSDSQQISEKGASVTASRTPVPASQFTVVGLKTPSAPSEMVLVNITLE